MFFSNHLQSSRVIDNDFMRNLMRVAVSAIMKNNYKYIQEWINHYLSIGFDTVIIYDNNDVSDNRRISPIPYGRVIVHDYRSKYSAQLDAINNCYKQYSKSFDYIAFFDSDEYLILNKWRNVHDMLNEFKGADIVSVGWINYDDMGIIKRDESIPVNKFFTRPSKIGNTHHHYKNFIKTGINNIYIHQHSIESRGKSLSNIVRVDLNHMRIDPEEYLVQYLEMNPFKNAFIKHVMTKTLIEYINEKAFNGKPTGVNDKTTGKSFGYFFDINERTPEKERIVNNFIKDYENRCTYRFLLNPTFASVKKYTDEKYNIVIVSDEKFANYLNRTNRIIIMDILQASAKYPSLEILR